MSHEAVLWVVAGLGCFTIGCSVAAIRINRETARLWKQADQLWKEAERTNAETLQRLQEMNR